MNSKKTNFFEGSFEKLAMRLTLLLAFIIPLADAIILSPFCEILLANIGDGVLYEIFSKLSELIVTTAFLSVCALTVCALFAGKTKLASKIFWLEIISFIFLVVLLKPFVLWFNAFLDEYIFASIGTFALSNYTLAQIRGEMLVWWAMISLFMNVLMLALIMVAVYFFTKLKISSIKATGRKLSNETLLSGLPKNTLLASSIASPSVIYLITQIIFCITDTLDSIETYGAPVLISDYVFLILPFVYKIGFAVVGYFVCQYVAYVMISRLEKNQ